jgi:hypothetical protein
MVLFYVQKLVTRCLICHSANSGVSECELRLWLSPSGSQENDTMLECPLILFLNQRQVLLILASEQHLLQTLPETSVTSSTNAS